ncbi:hypothetical protein SpCBS45565_g07931 [Spizellomyces sp. 'palustris']|nr:hypothetical protein SpCBS45565_g07931 [Spizellomyces sp. 'palustris']
MPRQLPTGKGTDRLMRVSYTFFDILLSCGILVAAVCNAGWGWALCGVFSAVFRGILLVWGQVKSDKFRNVDHNVTWTPTEADVNRMEKGLCAPIIQPLFTGALEKTIYARARAQSVPVIFSRLELLDEIVVDPPKDYKVELEVEVVVDAPRRYERDFLLSLRPRATDMKPFLPAVEGVTKPSASKKATGNRDNRRTPESSPNPNAMTLQTSTSTNAPPKASPVVVLPASSPPNPFLTIPQGPSDPPLIIPDRRWETTGKSTPTPSTPATFSILTWNILAPNYCTLDKFPYAQNIPWLRRKQAILSELAHHHPDIVCLQELPQNDFTGFFAPALHSQGYRGVFRGKNRSDDQDDGCATFWKVDRFRLVECSTFAFPELVSNLSGLDIHAEPVDRPPTPSHDLKLDLLRFPNTAIITTLKCVHTNRKLRVVTTHLHWNPRDERTKLLQAGLLMDILSRCQAADDARQPSFKTPMDDKNRGTAIPIVLAGDLNSMFGEHVMQFLVNGSVNVGSKDFGWVDKDYGTFSRPAASPVLANTFILQPAYPRALLPYTNKTPTFSGTIDHILFSPDSLYVHDTLGPVPGKYMDSLQGLPCKGFSSDHVLLCAVLGFKGAGSKKGRKRKGKTGKDVDATVTGGEKSRGKVDKVVVENERTPITQSPANHRRSSFPKPEACPTHAHPKQSGMRPDTPPNGALRKHPPDPGHRTGKGRGKRDRVQKRQGAVACL